MDAFDYLHQKSHHHFYMLLEECGYKEKLHDECGKKFNKEAVMNKRTYLFISSQLF